MNRFFLIALLTISYGYSLLAQAAKKNTTVVAASSPTTETASGKTQESGKEVLAVYYFTTSRDYSYDYAQSVGNAVEAGFLRSHRFTLVERNRFGTIKEEEKFKEANTSEIVGKASKLGAKTIVTGHIVSVSQGNIVGANNLPTGNKYAQIGLSFKIIDVASGEIKYSEMINGKGEGTTATEAIQDAYLQIDKLVRANVGNYLPQRFKFMTIVSKTTHKKKEYLDQFKIWGGSDNGLKVGDAVEIYTVSYLTNPDTGKQIEEKKIIAHGSVLEVNSGTTATCSITNTSDLTKYNPEILDLASTPEKMIIEYKGNWTVKSPTIWQMLTH